MTIELGVALALLLGVYANVRFYLLDRSIKRVVRRQWKESDGLDWDTRSFIDKLVANCIDEDRERIIKRFEKNVKASLANDKYIEQSVQNAIKDTSTHLTEVASAQYISQHLPKIMGRIDIQAVSNAVLLKMTSKILDDNNTLNSEDPYTRWRQGGRL